MLSQLAPPVNKQTSKLQRSVAKVPPSEDKKKDPNIPAKDHLPTRLGHLPQGSSSSDWQPSYHPWEQSLQPHWEPYPGTAVTWQEEWASSNPQVAEQEQLLWALSDRPASRYRKPPPAQPKPPATVPKRTEREVRFTLPPEESKSPQSSMAIAKTVALLPRQETKEDTEDRPREAPPEEHLPPPRPGAHPKKCPVQ